MQGMQMRRLFNSNQTPAPVHFAHGKAPVEAARADQVIREHPHALRLVEFFAKDTITHL